MGRDSNFACRTCKKNYYLGYGSYSTWLDGALTIAEYDARDDADKDRQKNQNFRKCLEEHDGHDFVIWSDDWCYKNHGNLLIEGGYGKDVVIVEGFKDYEQIDLEKI